MTARAHGGEPQAVVEERRGSYRDADASLEDTAHKSRLPPPPPAESWISESQSERRGGGSGRRGGSYNRADRASSSSFRTRWVSPPLPRPTCAAPRARSGISGGSLMQYAQIASRFGRVTCMCAPRVDTTTGNCQSQLFADPCARPGTPSPAARACGTASIPPRRPSTATSAANLATSHCERRPTTTAPQGLRGISSRRPATPQTPTATRTPSPGASPPSTPPGRPACEPPT